MAKLKTYIAKVGITFEELKPPVHVEPGNEIPARLSVKTIEMCLANGDIEEVKGED